MFGCDVDVFIVKENTFAIDKIARRIQTSIKLFKNILYIFRSYIFLIVVGYFYFDIDNCDFTVLGHQ